MITDDHTHTKGPVTKRAFIPLPKVNALKQATEWRWNRECDKEKNILCLPLSPQASKEAKLREGQRCRMSKGMRPKEGINV